MSKKNKKQKINQELQAEVHNKKDEKREAIVGGQGNGSKKSTLVGICVAIAVIAIAGFIIFGGGGSGGGAFDVVKAEAGVVKIPVSQVSDGQAHFFTYKGRSKKINFFILKSSDGILRAAFDACDVCYREKKGYTQVGDLMVCRNCGQQFPSDKINVLRGGCNPAPLTRAVQGEYLVLKAADIETGAFYF